MSLFSKPQSFCYDISWLPCRWNVAPSVNGALLGARPMMVRWRRRKQRFWRGAKRRCSTHSEKGTMEHHETFTSDIWTHGLDMLIWMGKSDKHRWSKKKRGLCLHCNGNEKRPKTLLWSRTVFFYSPENILLGDLWIGSSMLLHSIWWQDDWR